MKTTAKNASKSKEAQPASRTDSELQGRGPVSSPSETEPRVLNVWRRTMVPRPVKKLGVSEVSEDEVATSSDVEAASSSSQRTPVQNSPKVGYRQPPREHQFRPGTSGNPGGKTKQRPPEAIIAELMNELLPTADGEMEAGEALCRFLRSRAFKGDKHALELIFVQWAKGVSLSAGRENATTELESLIAQLPPNHPLISLIRDRTSDTSASTNRSDKKGEPDA